MSLKSIAIESLLSSDYSGRLRNLHDQMVSIGLKTKMPSNTDTLLFEAVTPTRLRVPVIAIRGGVTEVISFPRAYWVRHPDEVTRVAASFESRHIVETEGFVSTSQYSILQIRVSEDTISRLQSLISTIVSSNVRAIRGEA